MDKSIEHLELIRVHSLMGINDDKAKNEFSSAVTSIEQIQTRKRLGDKMKINIFLTKENIQKVLNWSPSYGNDGDKLCLLLESYYVSFIPLVLENSNDVRKKLTTIFKTLRTSFMYGKFDKESKIQSRSKFVRTMIAICGDEFGENKYTFNNARNAALAYLSDKDNSKLYKDIVFSVISCISVEEKENLRINYTSDRQFNFVEILTASNRA
jgi:hypothetical protein